MVCRISAFFAAQRSWSWNPDAGSQTRINKPEKEMATHSSFLAWEIPWTEEPGGLPGPWGHKRVGHN